MSHPYWQNLIFFNKGKACVSPSKRQMVFRVRHVPHPYWQKLMFFELYGLKVMHMSTLEFFGWGTCLILVNNTKCFWTYGFKGDAHALFFFWNYLKLIIFESICAKVQIYCIFISKFENKILKINPQKKCTCLSALLTKPVFSTKTIWASTF